MKHFYRFFIGYTVSRIGDVSGICWLIFLFNLESLWEIRNKGGKLLNVINFINDIDNHFH